MPLEFQNKLWELPQPTPSMPLKEGTRVGYCWFWEVPRPSWPISLNPTPNTWPELIMRVNSLHPTTLVTLGRGLMVSAGEGLNELATFPMPSCPR